MNTSYTDNFYNYSPPKTARYNVQTEGATSSSFRESYGAYNNVAADDDSENVLGATYTLNNRLGDSTEQMLNNHIDTLYNSNVPPSNTRPHVVRGARNTLSDHYMRGTEGAGRGADDVPIETIQASDQPSIPKLNLNHLYASSSHPKPRSGNSPLIGGSKKTHNEGEYQMIIARNCAQGRY